MGTQIVTIVIRSVGSAATAANIRGVGAASRSAASSVRLLTSALAALGVASVVRELNELVDGYIRVSNQLRFASKSQEEFIAVQREVLAVANETRSPFETTALLYRRLRAATEAMGTSQREVLDVVKGLNAAVLISGANTQEARAGIIQFTQALQSGRLAGDELRSLLENLTPLAQAVANELGLTLGQLREQAKNIPVDVLFAAVQRAAAGFSAELGNVQFSVSQTFNVLRNELQSTLGQLNEFFGTTVTVNEGIVSLAQSVGERLKGALVSLISGFGSILGAGADVVDLLENLGITGARLGVGFRNLISFVKVFFAGVGTGFRTLLVGSNALVLALLQLGNAVGLISDAAVVEAQQDFADQMVKLGDSASDTSKILSDEFNNVLARSHQSLTEFGHDDSASNRMRELATGAQNLADKLAALQLKPSVDFDLTQRGTNQLQGVLSESQLKAIEAANKRIEAIVNRLRIAEQKRIDPLNAQIERLIQQRIELEKQARIAGVTAMVLEGRRLVDQQIADIQREQADAGQEVVEQIIELAKNIQEIATFAPQMADQLERSANAIVEAGGGSKEVAERLAEVNKESRDFLKERQGLVRQLGEGIVTGGLQPLAQELRGLLQGEAFSFGEALASAADNLLGNALDALIENAATSFGQIFQQQFGSNLLGGALASGALGVGLGLLAGAFRDTSANVTNDIARSAAVEEVQATRGVVAGPTNIPIFQVGESIEAAFLPTNALLTEIRDGIFALIGSAPAAAVTRDPAAEALQRSTPSLV